MTSTKSAATVSGNYTSLWWNSAQPGWGLAVSQQGTTAFGVLFGYDAAHHPSWSVLASGLQSSLGDFAGALYRAMPGDVQVVGDMSLAFTSSDGGVLNYRLDGAAQSAPLMREEFATPTSHCSP